MVVLTILIRWIGEVRRRVANPSQARDSSTLGSWRKLVADEEDEEDEEDAPGPRGEERVRNGRGERVWAWMGMGTTSKRTAKQMCDYG